MTDEDTLAQVVFMDELGYIISHNRVVMLLIVE
jgi:hypothetical protein